jgi:hypothetical protein
MKYTVILRSCEECGYGEVSPPCFAHAKTIEECSRRVRNYIEDYGLGSSQWCGGQVFEEEVGYIGKISYNGRFWSKDTEYGKE